MTTNNNTPDALSILKEYNFEIQNIPENLITQELYNEAFKRNIYSIKVIPYEYITQDMCDIAIEYDPFLIKFIPDKYITQKICDIAFKYDTAFIRFFPIKFTTEEMWDKAIKNDPFLIKYKPIMFFGNIYIRGLSFNEYLYITIILCSSLILTVILFSLHFYFLVLPEYLNHL